MDTQTILNIIQIITSIALILAVLLQVRGGGLDEMLGGSSSTFFRTRRGLEKRLFQATIALIAIFITVSMASVALA